MAASEHATCQAAPACSLRLLHSSLVHASTAPDEAQALRLSRLRHPSAMQLHMQLLSQAGLL